MESLRQSLLQLSQLPGAQAWWLCQRSQDRSESVLTIASSNASVECETHPLPKVDDTLAQLAGATVFSKFRHQ